MTVLVPLELIATPRVAHHSLPQLIPQQLAGFSSSVPISTAINNDEVTLSLGSCGLDPVSITNRELVVPQDGNVVE